MNDKLRILELLDSDQITPEEAKTRLKALKEKTVSNVKRTFKVDISSSDGDKVNIQIPLNFARMFLKGKKHFIKNDKFQNLDINFEEVLEMLDSGQIGELINIESADGDKVKIRVE